MIKIIFCLHRLPHLSRTAFQDYWRNQHGPLVAKKAAALGIRHYVQSHTLDDAAFADIAKPRGCSRAYDGVAELWMDAAVAAGGASGEEAVRAAMALLEGEKKFIDLPRSSIFYVREQEVVAAAAV